MNWDALVEQQIREGQAQGAFDGLPGTGKPLPGLDEPHDELWWVRAKLKREEVQYLPETLLVRREVDVARDRIATASTEAEVRRIAGAINERIRWVNSHAVSGPPSTMVPLDVDLIVERWREARPAVSAPAPPVPPPPAPPATLGWRRLRRRS